MTCTLPPKSFVTLFRDFVSLYRIWDAHLARRRHSIACVVWALLRPFLFMSVRTGKLIPVRLCVA